MIKLQGIGLSLFMAALIAGCGGQNPAPAVEMTPSQPTTTPTTIPVPPTASIVITDTGTITDTAVPTETGVTVTPETVTPETVTPETVTPETVTPETETGVGTGDAPPTSLDTGTAVVENLEVRFLESFPVQVQAVVSGYLPDGCTTITSVEALNAGTTFRIRMTTERPADAMCTMAVMKFEEVVPLETAGLPAGTYDVRVNDLMVTFELAGDGGAAQPPVGEQSGAGMHPDAGAHPVAETPTEFVLANVDVPIYDAPSTEAAEIGVIFGGQLARVTGASPDGAWWRVICPDDTVGDCWVSAAPEFTEPQAASN